jgi:hypothetical protein
MNKFIEVTYLDISNKRVKWPINTLYIFDVVQNPNNKGVLVLFAST